MEEFDDEVEAVHQSILKKRELGGLNLYVLIYIAQFLCCYNYYYFFKIFFYIVFLLIKMLHCRFIEENFTQETQFFSSVFITSI